MIQYVVSKCGSVRMLLMVGVLSISSAAMLNGVTGWAQSPEAASPAASATPEFEAATIKPVKEPDPNRMNDRTDGRHFLTHNTTLRDLLMMAYGLDPRQIVGGPAWLASDEYDLDAVAGEGQMANHREEMLQKLLADRFQLTFHREQREMSVYVLTIAKGGSKLKASDPNVAANGASCQRLGMCTFKGEPLQHFARWLQFVVSDRAVVDKTGIAGMFDFSLNWTPDETQFSAMGIHVPPPADNPNAPPGLFTAIQEQLGLKLEPQKIPSEVLVIDHVERPTEN
jgi:uncharacterized protein (TIGR03435 family)